ncbi:helix-turn-helix domain-containing protein [Microbacterium lushaniae]|nr:helix-turn-helix domain-containing protein [Microbacterium lushaniae]
MRKAAAKVGKALGKLVDTPVAEDVRVEIQQARAVTGSQTLGRGLSAFLAVVHSERGLTVQQVSEQLDAHRTIAYRLLQTLLDFGLVTRAGSGAYVAGARLATLADAYVPRLQDVALPVMQRLADAQESTVLLFIEQNGEAVAVLECEPTTGTHHIAFRSGMRTPLDRGAAAFALRAGAAPVAGEPEGVAAARAAGFARSQGAVLPGAYGVAAPIPLPLGSPPACLMVVTFLESVADASPESLLESAREIAASLDPVA